MLYILFRKYESTEIVNTCTAISDIFLMPTAHSRIWCEGAIYVSLLIDCSEWHYSDVMKSAMGSKSSASRLFAQTFVQTKIKEDIKAPRYCPLWRETTCDLWIPLT